ncbi:MAG TPA: hypothetical protein VEU72_03385 [Nitrosopumilaceae archaeon]|nr:hypothetical protein [Nitrosopumilaceae archaeon]
MTSKKAIEILDDFMKYKIKCSDSFAALSQKCYMIPGGVSGVAKQLENLNRGEFEILTSIRDEIQIQCSHPKKFRDIDPDGKPYCVGCNQDL